MNQSSSPILQTAFGPAAPELGWVPAPRYIMRRSRVLRWMRQLPQGKLLEVGCGSGAMLREIAGRGFDCVALESSPQALELARAFNADQPNVEICEQVKGDWEHQFDYVVACEVLEHIEHDEEALREWIRWLKPGGGRLILSVPAHQSLWNDSDVWVGHFRRYSRQQLIDLFERCGLTVQRVESYGFPLANWIEPIRTKYLKANRQKTGANKNSRAQNTATSGTHRTAEVRLFPYFGKLPGSLVMHSFCQLQRAFIKTDWGNGFLVMGQV